MTDLKTWRDERGLNQTELAALLDTSVASVSRVETGEQWPSPDLAAAIERVTKGKVTIADILKSYQSRRTQAAE